MMYSGIRLWCVVAVAWLCLSVRADRVPDSEEHGQHRGVKSTNCKCGWTNKAGGRIVGGSETKVNEYPYMVALARVGIMNSVSVFCGASIITKHHLLTAAHCTHGNTAQLAVIVGEHDLTTGRESAHTKRYLVNQVFNHEGFSMTTVKHDIAVLAVHVGIEFNEHVGPVCLPKKPVQLDNEWVKVTGWGRMHFEGKRSDVLNKVYLKVVPIKSCASMYTNIATTNPTQFCTFRQGKDSCMGDSGGPVVWLDPDTNMYTLVGLVSYGKGCADSVPGVNTMVHEYLDWVQDKIRRFPIPPAYCHRLD